MPLVPEHEETFAPLRPSWGCQGMLHCHYLTVCLADSVLVGRFSSLNSPHASSGTQKAPSRADAEGSSMAWSLQAVSHRSVHSSPAPQKGPALHFDLHVQSCSSGGVLGKAARGLPHEQKASQRNLLQARVPPAMMSYSMQLLVQPLCGPVPSSLGLAQAHMVSRAVHTWHHEIFP